MKKKILRWAIVPMVAAIGFVGFNSFTEGDESGSSDVEISKGYIKDPTTCADKETREVVGNSNDCEKQKDKSCADNTCPAGTEEIG